jgi:4-amino-4-deoxy-L-arabinose transferase-like glycosyltransferase
VILWGGWLLVTGVVFSFMAGIYHDYYTVALAPAIAALVAVAGSALWKRRTTWLGRAGLAGTMIITASWAFVLLGRATAPYSTMRWPVLGVGLVAGLGFLFVHRLPKLLAGLVLGLALIGAAAGPAAYAVNTAATPHQGPIVTAGPVQGGGFGAASGGMRARTDGAGTQGQPPQGGQVPQGGQAPPGGTVTDGGGRGEATANAELVSLLTANSDRYTWAAATTGSQGAASYQLASGQPVMAIGGFSGSDPSPTLEQFQTYVAEGKIHYYISGGNRGGPGGGDGSASQIASWVSANFTSSTVGGSEVYDLTTSK